MKTRIKPHERVKKCGARNRQGKPCQGFGMGNGRCKFHGGMSSGPKTEAGKRRIAQAHYKHGRYTKKAKRLRKFARLMIAQTRLLIQ